MQRGKLVRDRIPEIIEAAGRQPRVRTIDGDALLDALFAKLVEETHELRMASEGERAEELADVLEVVRALATHMGVDVNEVERLAERKRHERGGYAKGVWLLA